MNERNGEVILIIVISAPVHFKQWRPTLRISVSRVDQFYCGTLRFTTRNFGSISLGVLQINLCSCTIRAVDVVVWRGWRGEVGMAYLSHDIGAVPVEGVDLSIKGVNVRSSLH